MRFTLAISAKKLFARPSRTRHSTLSCHNIVLFTLGRTVARNSFCRFSPIMYSFEVASTECRTSLRRGVHSLVAWAGRAADIPQDEIDAVRRLVDSSLRIEPHPFLKCGDRVRIKSGSPEGIQGILVRKRSAFRLVLSVEMLAQSASVEVDISVVERVRSAEVERNDVLRIDQGGPSLKPVRPYSP